MSGVNEDKKTVKLKCKFLETISEQFTSKNNQINETSDDSC